MTSTKPKHIFSNPAACLAALLTAPDVAAEQATQIAAIINSVNAGSHIVEVGSGQEPSASIQSFYKIALVPLLNMKKDAYWTLDMLPNSSNRHRQTNIFKGKRYGQEGGTALFTQGVLRTLVNDDYSLATPDQIREMLLHCDASYALVHVGNPQVRYEDYWVIDKDVVFFYIKHFKLPFSHHKPLHISVIPSSVTYIKIVVSQGDESQSFLFDLPVSNFDFDLVLRDLPFPGIKQVRAEGPSGRERVIYGKSPWYLIPLVE